MGEKGLGGGLQACELARRDSDRGAERERDIGFLGMAAPNFSDSRCPAWA